MSLGGSTNEASAIRARIFHIHQPDAAKITSPTDMVKLMRTDSSPFVSRNHFSPTDVVRLGSRRRFASTVTAQRGRLVFGQRSWLFGQEGRLRDGIATGSAGPEGSG